MSSIEGGTLLERALRNVRSEVRRQKELQAEGRFRYVPSDDIPDTMRLAMLAEEFGEVAREVLALSGDVQEPGDIHKLRKELVQVAAIAVSWFEGMSAHASSYLPPSGRKGSK